MGVGSGHYSYILKKSTSKEMKNAKHKYMNNAPSPVIDFAMPLVPILRANSLILSKVLYFNFLTASCFNRVNDHVLHFGKGGVETVVNQCCKQSHTLLL